MGNKQTTKNNILLLGIDYAGKGTMLDHIKGISNFILNNKLNSIKNKEIISSSRQE